MNDIDVLTRRAQAATKVAGMAAIAKAHVENALREATNHHLDIAVRDDLDKCISTINRTIKHAEQCRLRLLRKSNRKGAIQP